MKFFTPFLLVLAVTTHAQTPGDSAVTQIRQLLKPGKHLVHYIRPNASKPLTPEQKALLAKVQTGLRDNDAWMLDTTKKVPGSKEDILDSIRVKLGLTKEEWKTFQDLTDPAKKGYDIYGEDNLEIISKGDQLYFQGTGNVEKLNSVHLDLTRNVVLFDQKQLPFVEVHHSTGADNAFHTTTVTYEYELDNSSMPDSTNISSMRLEKYTFGVAHFPLIGKTIVTFMTITVEGANYSAKPGIILVFLLE